MDKPRSPEVETFWNAYRAARDVPDEDYVVWSFGSGPDMSTELTACGLAHAHRHVKPLKEVDSAFA